MRLDLLMPRVYVIIINWNGWRDTLDCLCSVFKLTYENLCVIICDNGSNNDSLEQIIRWGCDVLGEQFITVFSNAGAQQGGINVSTKLVLIEIGKNLGFAGGNNVGMRYAIARGDADYVWLLNNDTVVDPAALSKLIERMVLQQDIGMCGSTIRYLNNPEKIQALGGGFYCRWVGLPWHYGRILGRVWSINQTRAEARMNYVEGASMLVSREFLEEVGLMCEDYFLYFEEIDWAIRASGRYSLAYAADSIIYHKVGASIGTSSNPTVKSFTCDYYNIRNRILFTKKYYPRALPTIYLFLLGTFILRVLLGKWDRVSMVIGLMIGRYKTGPAALDCYRN